MKKPTPLVEHMDQVLKCAAIEDVWALHTEKMAEYGFDRLLYGATQSRTHGLFGDFSNAFFLTNHVPEYVDALFGEAKLYLSVPKNDWNDRSAGAFNWRIFQDRMGDANLSDGEETVKELYARLGIIAGYSIRFMAPDQRSKGGIGLCARAGMTHDDVDALWAEMGDEIIMLNNLMHLKISGLPRVGKRRQLTSRQREVLGWVADGKTTKDVASIMNVSLATVEKHLRLARDRLDVSTTAQAVKIASAQNQLYRFEPEPA